MYIRKLQLKNFKRFTDLTVDLSGLQPPPRLVLMIGSNGSGKSCVFDAFEWVVQANRGSINGDKEYYRKNPEQMAETKIEFAGQEIDAHRLGDDLTHPFHTRAFYGRGALRQVPRLTSKRSVFQLNPDADEDRPRRYIDFDQRFENDVEMLTGLVAEEIFDLEQFDSNRLKARYVAPINQSLARVFGSDPGTSLTLHSLVLPLLGKTADIRFRKGKSEIHYDLLSSGEKEVINILINLLNRRDYYRDTIYFIDELDVHLNTSLQYNLLKEISENWLPDNCQLWTASHSFGFIQYAQESSHAAILDFDQFDFDSPFTITPQLKESLEVYEVAVPKEAMTQLLQNRKLVMCENKNDRYYNLLGLKERLFVGVQDYRQVYLNVKNQPNSHGLIDRDYLTDGEIARIRQHLPHLHVLGYYAFENYLFHPENIREAFPKFDVRAYQAEIVEQKNERRDFIIAGLELARRGHAVLNNENIERDEDAIEQIIMALRSDDLETFYPFFDMKTRFNRKALSKLNPSAEKLARTNWFRAAIGKVIE
jgi:predicted ATPase